MLRRLPTLGQFQNSNIYGLYIMFTGLMVTYLLSMPCPECQEQVSRLALNATKREIMQVLDDCAHSSSPYERSCTTIWFKVWLFLTVLPIVLFRHK